MLSCPSLYFFFSPHISPISLPRPLPPLLPYYVRNRLNSYRSFSFSALKVSLFLLPSGLALLGCSVSQEAIETVKQVLESIGPTLNLHAQPAVMNLPPPEAKQYLERHSLQFCVLVVDGETVKDAYENLPVRRSQYEDLFKTVVERVGKMSAYCLFKEIKFLHFPFLIALLTRGVSSVPVIFCVPITSALIVVSVNLNCNKNCFRVDQGS